MPFPKFWTQEKLTELNTLYQSGLSMREVGKRFGKSVWSVNSVMNRQHLIRRPACATRSLRFKNSPTSFQPKKYLSPEEEKLRIAGLRLYWGEGAKKNTKTVDFANSDPKMISLFMTFLRQIYQPDETKFRIYLY